MKAVFLTTEVINLLNHRVPRVGKPQFRLQNFLLGRADWKTSYEASLHIGERGELRVLEKALGDTRNEVLERHKRAIQEEYKDHPKNNFTFPTREAYRKYVCAVKKELGDSIELEIV